MSAFAGERRASKVSRGGAARARPGSVENDATLPPARRARYPPARIFHQSRGLARATAPGCQRGCRADLAGHDPGRNGQTHSIARLRRDRDPEPILYESIDPPGGPRSGPPVLLFDALTWNSLLARKILHAIRANISPGLGKVFREPLFGNLAFSLCAVEEGPHLPEGRRSHLGARAGAAREDRERGGRGEILASEGGEPRGTTGVIPSPPCQPNGAFFFLV